MAMCIHSRYLGYCNDPSKVRTQDFFSCVAYATYTPAGALYTWNWVTANYHLLIER